MKKRKRDKCPAGERDLARRSEESIVELGGGEKGRLGEGDGLGSDHKAPHEPWGEK